MLLQTEVALLEDYAEFSPEIPLRLSGDVEDGAKYVRFGLCVAWKALLEDGIRGWHRGGSGALGGHPVSLPASIVSLPARNRGTCSGPARRRLCTHAAGMRGCDRQGKGP